MRLRRSAVTMPGVPIGPPNPLCPLGPADDEHEVDSTEGLPADMATQVRYGRLNTVLPCMKLDDYDRDRRPMEFTAFVLENDRLEATVLPGIGGRVFSLVHKPSGRELLYRNPVFQPANFALNGAWYSGGIEWNIGSTGHTTLSVAPVHAARVSGPNGTPMLRLWEWERTRNLPFQVDLWLPDGSEFLYVGVRMRNPHDHEVPAYWWSNIAVPETRASRVIAPADEAWNFGYTHRLQRVPVPVWDGIERTYPLHVEHATDYFYETDPDDRHWITSLDESGFGLVQTSTDRLRGRKLFLWGAGSGCRHWQDWLTDPSLTEHGGYIELQAGLVRTQLEHTPLPAREEFAWVEAYGPLHVDPAIAHAIDWSRAREGTEAALRHALPRATVDAAYAEWREVADREPEEVLHQGSGWGALELSRMGTQLAGIPFDERALGDEQRPWLELLRTGALPDADPSRPPGCTLVARPWRELLEKAPSTWSSEYHLGVARWEAQDVEGAVTAWKRSLDLADSPWAQRNLAFVARESGRHDEAIERLTRALDTVLDSGAAPNAVAPLGREIAEELLVAGRAADCLRLIERLPEDVRAKGRFRMLEARARTELGDLDNATAIFDAGFVVDDLHEGDEDVHDVWFALTEARTARAAGRPVDDEIREQARRDYPLPPRYDYRMRPHRK